MSISFVEHTNAKSPKEFCNEYKPNLPQIPVQIKNFVFDPSSQHLQPQDQQYEQPFIDLNLRLSLPEPGVYPGEPSSFNCNQAETHISHKDSYEILGFDLNKSPPKD